MIITTKFDIGDYCVPIRLMKVSVFIPCTTCDGTGRATLKNEQTISCPTCYGRKGATEWHDARWGILPDAPGDVGKIEATRYDPFSQHHRDDSRTRYMLWSTGVGSGSVYSEDDCFASRDEAQAECDARNALLAQ
jgi:hypothetical protein